MIRIALFEDHPIVLKSLIACVKEQANFDLIFTSISKTDFFDKLKVHTVDVAVVDVLANDVTGLEVYEYIHKKFPFIKIISFTSLSSPILVENLLGLGVKGYVNKNQEIEDLVSAINTVANNGIYLPTDYQFLSSKYHQLKTSNLTEREIQIIQLISREYTTNDIALQLTLSVNTIENHRKKIFEKLEVKNVAGMVREASKLGYL